MPKPDAGIAAENYWSKVKRWRQRAKNMLSDMYHRQQNKWYLQRCQIVRKTAVNRSTLQWNLTYLLSSVASKWTGKYLWGYHLFSWRWYILNPIVSQGLKTTENKLSDEKSFQSGLHSLNIIFQIDPHATKITYNEVNTLALSVLYLWYKTKI